MIDHGKRNVLGVRIDAVDESAAVERILVAARARRPAAVSTLTVSGILAGITDRRHRHRLNGLDLLVPGGRGLCWALNWLHGVRSRDRLDGWRLMLRLCEAAAREGLPVFLYGGHETELPSLMAHLTRRLPDLQIAGFEPSRFGGATIDEPRETLTRIRQSGAALTFVALDPPDQELWVVETRPHLSMPLVGVGRAFGAWPRRSWRRHLVCQPLYFALVALQYSGLRRFDPDEGLRPTEDLNVDGQGPPAPAG